RAIVASLLPGQRLTLVPHFLALECVHNERGAMGLFGAYPGLLVALALAVLVGLALMLRASIVRSPLAQVAYGLIAGGALGNVVDRALHGYVVDFVALPGFWIFNVGDACITAGLVLLAIPAFRTRAAA
ncbi:MAG: signal peptidase II, partial [Candidatus Eremiobacteraeota bacterium]|nr:signal peptidase II [Candidatus Eremiobacteraeota bacterium]